MEEQERIFECFCECLKYHMDDMDYRRNGEYDDLRLANESGIGRPRIHKLITGQASPTDDEILLLVETLDVPEKLDVFICAARGSAIRDRGKQSISSDCQPPPSINPPKSGDGRRPAAAVEEKSSPDCSEFGNYIRQIRQKKEKNAQWLSTKVGCTVQELTAVEEGEIKPALKLAHKIAFVLFLSPAQSIEYWRRYE